jgi:tRNA threonylcarbamoyladenosine biosynthesis protein TsaE
VESIYTTKSPEETIELGKRLAYRLTPGDLVLLFGDLGSGKTHFIKGIAEGLGINAVIKSPTYAYVNRYPITQFPIPNSQLNPKSEIRNPKYNLYHYDLYRFEEGADISSIGFEESLEDPNAINVVEWADRLGDRLPKKYISVKLDGAGNKRSIKIKFVSPAILSETEIYKYYEEWATPMHVREHCAKVTEVAMKIAQAYIHQGEIINLNLLYPACMLHDMNRVCDFRKLVRSRFEEEVTDEKWEKWQSCRREYKGMHHADITAKIIGERGFTETAELIRLHRSDYIVEQPDAFASIEKKIIYYADKRVKHNEIVSLKERFRDGRERYGKFDTPEEKKLFEEVEIRTKKLEKELFDGIGIKPADIN